MSLYASGSSYADGIIEYDFFYEPWTFHYFTSNVAARGFDSVRDRLVGNYRTETNPIAVERASAQTVRAWRKPLRSTPQAPGPETRRGIASVLHARTGPRGVGQADAARSTANPGRWTRVCEQLSEYWKSKASMFQCATPNPGMNSMVNTWTLYQSETCVVWSRFASFVEVGGRTGLGYRDTSQDVMAVPHTNPAKVKQRLLELLHGQVSAGYGLHLFDPQVFAPKDEKLPGVKLPTVVPTPSPGRYHPWARGHLFRRCALDHSLDLRVCQGDGRRRISRPGGAVCRYGRGLRLRSHETIAGFFRRTNRSDRDLQRSACGLERLSESWRRGKRDGFFPASLGAAAFH